MKPLIHILCNNDAVLRAYPTEEAAMAEAVRLQALAEAARGSTRYSSCFYHVHGVELAEDGAGLEATAREAATHGAMLQVREDNERLAARAAELEQSQRVGGRAISDLGTQLAAMTERAEKAERERDAYRKANGTSEGSKS